MDNPDAVQSSKMYCFSSEYVSSISTSATGKAHIDVNSCAGIIIIAGRPLSCSQALEQLADRIKSGNSNCYTENYGSSLRIYTKESFLSKGLVRSVVYSLQSIGFIDSSEESRAIGQLGVSYTMRNPGSPRR